MDIYDVIVVGGGSSGTATAAFLARGALRTLLVDRAPRGVQPLPVSPLTRAGVLQASRLGIIDDLVAAGTPPVQRSTFRYGDEEVVISHKRSHGIDALYAPRRPIVETALAHAALDAGVEMQPATTVTDLIVQQGRVAGVRTKVAGAPPVDLHAALVIGADGVDSIVARAAGSNYTRISAQATATISALWPDLPAVGFEWNFHPDACSGFVPTSEGVCVYAAASRARVANGDLDTMIELVEAARPELAPRLRAATPPPAVHKWSGTRGFIRQSAGRGWALVGDAGYFKNPASAHGCTDALRDAALLARAVLNGCGDDTSLDHALGNYETTRDRTGVPLFDITDRIAGGRWDDTEIEQLLLQCNSAMAHEAEVLAALEEGVAP